MQSIQRDADWVIQCQDLFRGLPLVANLRNGEWYGSQWDAFSYFKSGDGHNNEWKFSYTRLNLHIAELAAAKSGCIIVDSTRRGKQYPDSFTATVPLWCGVINTIVFGTASGLQEAGHQAAQARSTDETFIGPPWMPASQQSSIQTVISETVSKMPVYLREYIRALLSVTLLKPLHPVWVSPIEGMLDVQGDEAACESLLTLSNSSECCFVPVVLLSVSEDRTEREHREEGFSWFYVKGAGDDHENWCRGLTPSVFWSNEEIILASDDPGCVDEVTDELVGAAALQLDRAADKCHAFGDTGLFISQHSCLGVHGSGVRGGAAETSLSGYDAVICIDAVHDLSLSGEQQRPATATSLPGGDQQVLHIDLDVSAKKKSGQDMWQDLLSSCLMFYLDLLKNNGDFTASYDGGDGDGNGGSDGGSDDAPISQERQWRPRVLIHSKCHCSACDDAQCAITTALLLCFYDVGFEDIISPAALKTRAVTKADVQIWAGLVQSRISKAVLSRSLLKELNRFFVSGSSKNDCGADELGGCSQFRKVCESF